MVLVSKWNGLMLGQASIIEDFDFSSLSSYTLFSVGVVGMRVDICLQLSSLLHVSDGS
jgi:hypothetical protein